MKATLRKGLTNHNAVMFVAKVSPWLAPLPAAYFVARSAMHHFAAPLSVAVVIAAVLETLGLVSAYNAQWAAEWNNRRNKNEDGKAPLWLPVVMIAAYIILTTALIVVLEVAPWLAVYALALFPFLSLIGAVNLTFIARQEKREGEREERLAERRAERKAQKAERKSAEVDDAQVQETQFTTKSEHVIWLHERKPELTKTQLAQVVGCSPSTVTRALT